MVGSVRNSSPAAEYMKVGDELLTLMGEPVFDWELGEIKSALRNLGMVQCPRHDSDSPSYMLGTLLACMLGNLFLWLGVMSIILALF